MPNKYPQGKGWNVPKQKYKLSNWSEYNKALKQRGRIDTWVSADAVNKWYEPDQTNTGTGAAKKYTDFAIIVCHQIRQVYRLPLRQSEGFINSIFNLMRIDIKCPRFSTLSKRLATDEGALDDPLDQVNTEAKHVSLDGPMTAIIFIKKYQVNLKMPISLFLQIKMQ